MGLCMGLRPVSAVGMMSVGIRCEICDTDAQRLGIMLIASPLSIPQGLHVHYMLSSERKSLRNSSPATGVSMTATCPIRRIIRDRPADGHCPDESREFESPKAPLLDPSRSGLLSSSSESLRILQMARSTGLNNLRTVATYPKSNAAHYRECLSINEIDRDVRTHDRRARI